MASSSFDLPGLTDDIDITIGQHTLVGGVDRKYRCANDRSADHICEWVGTFEFYTDALVSHRTHQAEEIVKLLAQWGDMEAERQ